VIGKHTVVTLCIKCRVLIFGKEKGAELEMAEQDLHYFMRGNTAQGLVSLADSIFQGLGTIYVLQGFPGGTEAMMGRIAAALEQRGFSLQRIHQPLDHESLEGIIVTNLSFGIVDGNAWSVDAEPVGADIRYIDLCSVLDTDKLEDSSEEIERLQRQIDTAYEQAYDTFLKTLHIHDDWEKIYIDHLDREAMNTLAAEWSEQYLQPVRAGKKAQIVHRFLGAATWRGAIDFVPNLTDRLQTRIYVKGRPGSGKSTLFKSLAASAELKGIDTEVYHCGFDPNSLDMLIFPELGIAIFDSTAPHEHFPVRQGDQILDVYQLAIAEGTDEKFADAVLAVKNRYSASMKQSIAHLAEAKELRDQLKDIYQEAATEGSLFPLERTILSGIEARV